MAFHGKAALLAAEAQGVVAFLNDLALRNMSASSHLQALNALLFLFRHVLGREVGTLEGLRRMRRPQRVPVVLSVEEVRATLNAMKGMPRLIAALLSGSGMRVGEALALRVKDLDLRAGVVIVRAGKGAKDRMTIMPARLVKSLEHSLLWRLVLHREEKMCCVETVMRQCRMHWIASIRARRGRSRGSTCSPRPRCAIAHEPGAARAGMYRRRRCRSRSFKSALQDAGIHRHAGLHVLRHSFATHQLAQGVDIRTIQQLLGIATWTPR